jgi:hypothetical protein
MTQSPFVYIGFINTNEIRKKMTSLEIHEEVPKEFMVVRKKQLPIYGG